MHLMLRHSEPDDFVIALGETHSMHEFLCNDLHWSGPRLLRVREVDKLFYRPAEVDLLIGDSTKALTVLGWQPQYTFQQLVKEMVQRDLGVANGGNTGVKVMSHQR